MSISNTTINRKNTKKIAVTGNKTLKSSIRKVLETLSENQTEKGHIPSLVHDKDDRGSSDTTPLFLLGIIRWG